MENNPTLTNPGNLLAIIGLIIALATYISTVRHRLIEKRKQTYLLLLLVADVPLVVAGFLLGIYVLSDWAPGLYYGLRLFVFALVVLALLHALEWLKTTQKNLMNP